jgi:putative transposase
LTYENICVILFSVMKKRRALPPTKTLRFRLARRPQADVWFGETQALFNQVASFYFDVIEAHPGVLECSDQEALTTLERFTHRTKANADPVMPLAEAIPGDIPAMFRRSAIHAALGSARSFRSNLERWRSQKARAEEKAKAKGKRSTFHMRPPIPPRQWNKSTVFYDGMWKAFDGQTVLLKVWTGRSWASVKFQVFGRAIPEGWKLGSPQLVHRSRHWHLHVPIMHSQFQFPVKGETTAWRSARSKGPTAR